MICIIALPAVVVVRIGFGSCLYLFRDMVAALTEDEARKLIISAVDDYLESVNHDEVLRPHLRDYPFTPKNLELTIYNYEEDGKDIYYPFNHVVNNREGRIGYFTKEESKKYGYKTTKHETYDEAVAILKMEKEQNSSSTQ